ncbi:MAG: hypothetical protein M1838_004881 [Thelocarpon superellum]|nr:MAG: hypothetical protein M1838_004881 [Thelocarpon superellum]
MAGGQKRIGKELAEVTEHPPEGITASLVDEADIYRWQITMEGPSDSPYAVISTLPLVRESHDGDDKRLTSLEKGGVFKLLLVLPREYPFKPPALNFQTKIYHPNITNDAKGSMCLGMLKSDEWKPSSKISGVLRTARNLLVEPNPDDAVETSIADQYKQAKREFDRTVKDWVKRYAKK